MKLRLAAPALLGMAMACAETTTLPLSTDRPATLTATAQSADAPFRDPRSYLRHGAASRTTLQRVTFTNTGSTPVTGQLLVINGQDWSSAESLRKSLRFPDNPRVLMQRLLAFWCDHLTHADSDAPGGKEPLALLNFWGYGLCGDSTAALTHLATSYGIAARKIPLNGHVAAEFFYDDAWHVHDSDQNVCYLRLDNRTLASAADLRADPLLARRTKVFGRYAAMDVTAAAFNTSLHEFIEPHEERPIKFKTPPAPVRAVTLFPGEQMILHPNQAPEQAVGRTDLRRWGTVREDALCVIEYVLQPKARTKATAGEIEFSAGYPILSAVNHTTGETVTPTIGQPTFESRVKFRTADDRISIFCQRARASLPDLRPSDNTFTLAVDHASGHGDVVVDLNPAGPETVTPSSSATLAAGTPEFRVTPQPGVDQLWWQVSAEKDFAFVAPNFDAVIPAADTITFDPLTATFFNPEQTYFFRVKARHAGVWNDWSAPVEFRVTKPARAGPIHANVAGPRLRLSWPDAGEGCEYLVFGSNRLDFLPEVFAEEEIVAMKDKAVEEARPNRNLIATLTKPEVELEPTCRFYRVLVRRNGLLSVPSDLVRTPSELATRLPPALVLQDRWSRANGVDVHVAAELPLP